MSDTLKGVVKWFNDAKGFGFIEHSSGKDVFVHYSVIQSEGFKTLKDGEVVEYEVSEGPKGLHAQNVHRVAEASGTVAGSVVAGSGAAESGAKETADAIEHAAANQSSNGTQATTRVARAGGFRIAVDSTPNEDSEGEEEASHIAAIDSDSKDNTSSRME